MTQKSGVPFHFPLLVDGAPSSGGHAADTCGCCAEAIAATRVHAQQPEITSSSASPSFLPSSSLTASLRPPSHTCTCTLLPAEASSGSPLAKYGGCCGGNGGAGCSGGSDGCTSSGNARPRGGSSTQQATTTSFLRERRRRRRSSAISNHNVGIHAAATTSTTPVQRAAGRLDVLTAQLVAGSTIVTEESVARKAGLLGRASAGGLGAATVPSPPRMEVLNLGASTGAEACACTENGCCAEVTTAAAAAVQGPAVAAAAAAGGGNTAAARPAATMGARAKLPTRFGDFEIVAFECEVPGIETGAVVKGDVRGKEAVPVRLHSACFTGDLMGSLRCDCRDQLEAALEQIGAPSEECGAVVYLQQEGRGIGLVNKIKAYALQDQGMDTVEANHALGFADDLRTYECAAAIVKALGCKSITLLSNNPKKAQGMEEHGVKVAAMRPLITPPNPHNAAYLATKKAKSGHLL